MRGKFITIYGINNIGKSTHAKIIVEKLEAAGQKAKYIKYPIYDLEPTGPFLNNTLRSPDGQKIPEDELQMWFVLNRYQYEPTVRELLDQGVHVIAEDYVGTGIAWGMAKGLEEQWLEELNKFLLKSDLSLVLEGERTLKAREETHVHERNDELVEKCLKTHAHLTEKHGWKRVALQAKKEDTAALFWKEISEFLDL